MRAGVISFYFVLVVVASIVTVTGFEPRSSSASALLCPVSDSIADANSLRHSISYFTYPVDIYDDKLFKSSLHNHFVECQSIQSGKFPFNIGHHNCSRDINVCPLYPDNLHDATLRMKSWLNQPYLCHYGASLRNQSEDVYIVVFGGSVTVGTSCDGCCTAPECQYKTYRSGPHALCSWTTYLTNWLNGHKNSTSAAAAAAAAAARVTLKNFAEAGFNSATMAEQVGDRLFELDRPLTSKDVVFLDHSVNDKNTEEEPLLHSVEAMVRRIYRHSDPQSPPTIILLEMAVTGAYNAVYQRVAEHYSLPVWSYRDVASSHFARINQSEYVDYLLLNNTEFIHPSWHIHLFYADMIAALMIREFKKCDSPTATLLSSEAAGMASTVSSSQDEEERLDLADLHRLQRNSFQRLRPPLTPQVDDEVCYTAGAVDSGGPSTALVGLTSGIQLPLLSIAANDVLHNNSHAIVGSFSLGYTSGNSRSSSDIVGWRVFEDRVGEGRGGFIYDPTTTITGARTTSAATTAATAAAHVEYPSLYFSLRVNLSEFMSQHSYPMRLQVTYLKTYFNAGRVKIFICNETKELTTLDALWPDYATNRVSIPQVAQNVHFSNLLCNASAVKDGTAHPVIEFRHFYPPKDDCGTIVRKNRQSPVKTSGDRHAAECIARDEQKFKIYSVKICKKLR